MTREEAYNLLTEYTTTTKNRKDFIFTKEYRDANPLKCNGEEFVLNTSSDPNSPDFVYLSEF